MRSVPPATMVEEWGACTTGEFWAKTFSSCVFLHRRGNQEKKHNIGRCLSAGCSCQKIFRNARSDDSFYAFYQKVLVDSRDLTEPPCLARARNTQGILSKEVIDIIIVQE